MENDMSRMVEAWYVFRVEHMTKKKINKRYRELVKMGHPDVGGSDKEMVLLTEFRDILLGCVDEVPEGLLLTPLTLFALTTSTTIPGAMLRYESNMQRLNLAYGTKYPSLGLKKLKVNLKHELDYLISNGGRLHLNKLD